MQSIKENLEFLQGEVGDYVRLPQSAAESIGINQEGESKFGCEARLVAIKDFLAQRKSDFVIDLGGNCGFFGLSLLEEEIVARVLILDHEPLMIKFGNEVASYMGLEESIDFQEQSISLDGLADIPACDVVICQNLLHHAGSIFDLEQVQDNGWGVYATKFLKELRNKSQHAVIGVNFEEGKPVDWFNNPEEKATHFAELMAEAGWKVQRMGRVFDLVKDRMSSGKSDAVSGSAASELLMNRAARSFLTKLSITGSRLLGESWLGRFLRGRSLAKSYKKALHETRSIRTDHYYYFFAD